MKYRILIDEETIRQRIKVIADEISAKYIGKTPLLVGILKGAYIFLADLSRAMSVPHTIDFMAVSSYGSSTKTSGIVRIMKDLDSPTFQKHVIIIEDIIDTGLTLKYITKVIQTRSPASLEICTLLDKSAHHPCSIVADYVGFKIPDHFVIGYGLDYDQHYRNLPYIAYFQNEE